MLLLDRSLGAVCSGQRSSSRTRHRHPAQILPAVRDAQSVSESTGRRRAANLKSRRLECVVSLYAGFWDPTIRTAGAPVHVLNCNACHTASLPVSRAQNVAHSPVIRSQGSKENQETIERCWENRSVADGVDSNSGRNAWSASSLCVGLRRLISESLIRSSRKNAPVTPSGRSPDLRLPTGISVDAEPTFPRHCLSGVSDQLVAHSGGTVPDLHRTSLLRPCGLPQALRL